MTECDHEEADTRMLIHLLDALQNGCTNCLVCTVDTDVLVILLGKFHHLSTLCQGVNIWVAFGSGKNYTSLHHIAKGAILPEGEDNGETPTYSRCTPTAC